MTGRLLRHAGLLVLTALWAAVCGNAAAAETPEHPVTIPFKTWYEGRTWRADPTDQEENLYLEADFDGDNETEVVIGYVGSYKPPIEVEKEEGPKMFEGTPKTKDIPIIERRVFYKIYDRDAGGQWTCVRTLKGLEHPGEAHAVPIQPDGLPGLLIISPGGENYRDISLYQWREGGYRLLDNIGIAQPFTVHKDPVFYIALDNTDSIIEWVEEERGLIKKKGPHL